MKDEANEAGEAIHELVYFLAYGETIDDYYGRLGGTKWWHVRFRKARDIQHRAKYADWGRDNERQ